MSFHVIELTFFFVEIYKIMRFFRILLSKCKKYYIYLNVIEIKSIIHMSRKLKNLEGLMLCGSVN